MDWISVNDRLPETEDRVLCCTKTAKGVQNIVIGYYMGGKWRCGMNSRWPCRNCRRKVLDAAKR